MAVASYIQFSIKISRKKNLVASDMVCERGIAFPREHLDDPMNGRHRAASENSDFEEGACNVAPFDTTTLLELLTYLFSVAMYSILIPIEMMRVNVFDYEWRCQLQVGDQVDAQNVFGNWCPAKVLQVAEGEVLLQFLNMHETWRQWLQLESGRLSQAGTKVR